MWFFRSPQICFGEDALLHIGELKGKRALVISDQDVQAARLVDPVLIQLEHAGFATTVFAKVPVEPAPSHMQEGAEAAAAFNPDCIVAVGGGSVMDAAKGIWVLYDNPKADLSTLSTEQTLNQRESARLCCVPTTAGSGSEATHAFMLTTEDEQGNPRKVAVSHPLLMPDLAVVDPAMTQDLPQEITADGGMDALTHAIEGYTSTWSNEYSDGLCLAAITKLFEYLPRAYKHAADDMESREQVANAATLAGLGYINSMVGAAHSMAHAAGATFALPHGRVAGLFLPYVIEFSAARNRPAETHTRYAEIMAHLGHGQMEESEAGTRLAAAVRGLARGMNQPLTLSQAGVGGGDFKAALPTLIDHALSDTALLTAPRQPSESELSGIFNAAHG